MLIGSIGGADAVVWRILSKFSFCGQSRLIFLPFDGWAFRDLAILLDFEDDGDYRRHYFYCIPFL